MLKRASRDASLFRQRWQVEAAQWTYQTEIQPALKLGGGQAPATTLRLVVSPPTDTLLPDLGSATVVAWVFGRILGWAVENGVLVVRIKAIALLRDLAS